MYIGCSNQILPLIKYSIGPTEKWDILQDSFDYKVPELGRTQMLRKVHACHPAKDEKMTTYCTSLVDCSNQLSSSAEAIS
jgi:hypothetical protein